jgi:hypothetical protein
VYGFLSAKELIPSIKQTARISLYSAPTLISAASAYIDVVIFPIVPTGIIRQIKTVEEGNLL